MSNQQMANDMSEMDDTALVALVAALPCCEANEVAAMVRTRLLTLRTKIFVARVAGMTAVVLAQAEVKGGGT